MKSTYEKRYGHSRTKRATHPLREMRRSRAKARLDEWNKLTDREKLAIMERNTAEYIATH